MNNTGETYQRQSHFVHVYQILYLV